MLKLEDLINRLTYTLVRDGAFVNFIGRDLLEKSIGEVCARGTSDVYGIILAMRLENFFPQKFLIPFINFKSRRKELLNVFVETIKEKYDLGANWRYLLVPIQFDGEKMEYFFLNSNKYYSDVRFIDSCRKQGIKLLDQSMLMRAPENPILPINLIPNKNEESIVIRIIEKWFEKLKRNEYYETQNLSKDVFNSNISNEGIQKTVIAHLIFSIFESYDYFMALDIIEKLNPFYIFDKLMNNYKNKKNITYISRRTLRYYVSYSFRKLMGDNPTIPQRYISHYEIIRENLKLLLNNMEINNSIPFMQNKGVFPKKESI